MQVDPKLLEVALSKAIIDAVSADDTRAILAQAMHGYLFTKTRESYSGKETDPLTEAFRKALDGATLQLVRSFLDEPEQRAAMRAAIEAAFAEAMKSTIVTDKIAEKLLGAFTRF